MTQLTILTSSISIIISSWNHFQSFNDQNRKMSSQKKKKKNHCFIFASYLPLIGQITQKSYSINLFAHNFNDFTFLLVVCNKRCATITVHHYPPRPWWQLILTLIFLVKFCQYALRSGLDKVICIIVWLVTGCKCLQNCCARSDIIFVSD